MPRTPPKRCSCGCLCSGPSSAAIRSMPPGYTAWRCALAWRCVAREAAGGATRVRRGLINVPAPQPASAALQMDLAQMLETLDEEDRAMVILKYAEGYSFEELASIFGLSVSACKMRVSRAREKVQRKLAGNVRDARNQVETNYGTRLVRTAGRGRRAARCPTTSTAKCAGG